LKNKCKTLEEYLENEISAQDVAKQFSKALEMLYSWFEYRMGSNQSNVICRTQDNELILMKSAEVAEVLNVSKSQGYHLIQKEEIPCVRLWRFVRVR
jgi:predicted DNA-binding protein YlxM (UPF0122 family)